MPFVDALLCRSANNRDEKGAIIGRRPGPGVRTAADSPFCTFANAGALVTVQLRRLQMCGWTRRTSANLLRLPPEERAEGRVGIFPVPRLPRRRVCCGDVRDGRGLTSSSDVVIGDAGLSSPVRPARE